MATYTPNLNLKKPDYTDLADVADINANMDIIDGLTQDNIPSGTTNKVYTATEKTKLAGIATGANKTVIANNLTTTVAGSALDATQGKALADLVSTKLTKFVGTTTGTSTALAVTIAGATLADFTNIQVRLHTDLGASATLNLNGLGAKPIYTSNNTAVGVGALTGSMLNLIYNSTLGRWYLLDILPIPPYEANMIQFFAIPSKSGQIRLKVEKPTDSSGVMIRCKTTAWGSGDTKDTGTLIANVTDDTAYKGVNQWYEVTGLTDGTTYYFKAFPNKGDAYNQEIGVNETVCKAGGLYLELTMDSISGSTVNDTSGNGRNKTLINLTFESGLVGNCGRGNGTGYINIGSLSLVDKTICCWVNYGTPYTTDTRAFEIGSTHGTINLVAIPGSNSLLMSVKGAGTVFFTNTEAPYNANNFFCGKNTGNACKYRCNDGEYKNATGSTTQFPSANDKGCLFAARDMGDKLSGTIDQFRIFERELEDYEVDNLYNGGAGC